MIIRKTNVLIDGSKTIQQLAAECNLEITIHPEDKNRVLKRMAKNIQPRVDKAAIFYFNNEMDMNMVITEMRKENCSPATAETVLSLLVKEPELLKAANAPIIAPGLQWMDMNMTDYVVCISTTNEDAGTLTGRPIGKGWGKFAQGTLFIGTEN